MSAEEPDQKADRHIGGSQLKTEPSCGQLVAVSELGVILALELRSRPLGKNKS